MSAFTWSDVHNSLEGLVVGTLPLTRPCPQPQAFSTNSQTITAGQWFIPLKGQNFDGHSFIGEALAKGAEGFFYSVDQQAGISPQLRERGICVSDTLKALQGLARGWRRKQGHVQVFALTGSVGKTTCKEFLASMLASIGPTHCSRGNFNNEVGVPLSLLRIQPEHHYSVIEMGARSQGDIKALVAIAEPNFVACLNVHPVHIANFGSLETIYKTKLEIIAPQAYKTRACVFTDQAELLAKAQAIRPDLITFGQASTATVQLQNVQWLPQGGMRVSLRYGKEPLVFTLPLAHDTYPINIAAACALAFAAGLPGEKLTSALAQFRGVPGRFYLVPCNNLLIVDDTYNANPQSMAAGLQSLVKNFPQQRKTVVLGDMLELGESAPVEHQRLGKLCQDLVQPHLLLTVGELGEQIGQGARAAGLAARQHRHFATVDELIAAAIPVKDLSNILYAKASRGIQLDRFIAYLKHNC